MTEDHKDVNNRFQGTLHKVSGPLNRDVGGTEQPSAILYPCPCDFAVFGLALYADKAEAFLGAGHAG